MHFLVKLATFVETRECTRVGIFSGHLTYVTQTDRPHQSETLLSRA